MIVLKAAVVVDGVAAVATATIATNLVIFPAIAPSQDKAAAVVAEATCSVTDAKVTVTSPEIAPRPRDMRRILSF